MEGFAINAVGPALIAKHLLPLLPREGKAVFAALSARVGSISDNRLGGWYGYRASKAALNQLIRTLSIELARQRKDAIRVGLHPGTVDSALSRPFQSSVGRLFTPMFAAERLLTVIDGLDVTQSGQLLFSQMRALRPLLRFGASCETQRNPERVDERSAPRFRASVRALAIRRRTWLRGGGEKGSMRAGGRLFRAAQCSFGGKRLALRRAQHRRSVSLRPFPLAEDDAQTG